ncbi:MAG: sigma-54 dependent transcriptional regulator [Syntrophobacteraceae bacterium]|nr:sigma-54 dependent transcriptional regulator [Syntrophobacteraceae bacterium]
MEAENGAPERVIDTLLIVDDEQDMVRLLKRVLEPDLGCEVRTALSGEAALAILEKDPVGLVLLDVKMPGMDGLEVLERIRRDHPWLTVVMMTAHGTISLAVQAIKTGAYDFITKPFDHEALLWHLTKALERSRLLRENRVLHRRVHQSQAFRNIVGKSAKMQRVFEAVQMVAKTDVTVLITGESGTGKDLLARAIHDLSDRQAEPFVAVNCPAVPENILESELFGYRKGAFTHAVQNRIGLFQEAHCGTLFLDEVGDISTTIQTKLLRVLQTKEFKPLGDTKSIRVDFRLVASTNRNLPEKIKRGEFREDLFYRLNVLPIELPPLRERREDIFLLVHHFLEKHCRAFKRPLKKVSSRLMELFFRWPWEGNVRELENIIMRGVLLAPAQEIDVEHVGLKEELRERPCLVEESAELIEYREAKEEVLRKFHENYLEKVLSATQGNVTHAARLCGLERQGLQQVMRRYGIQAEKYRENMDDSASS